MNGNRRRRASECARANAKSITYIVPDPNPKTWKWRWRRATTTSCGRALVRSPSAGRPAVSEEWLGHYVRECRANTLHATERVPAHGPPQVDTHGSAGDRNRAPGGRMTSIDEPPTDNRWLEPFINRFH